MNKHEHNSPHKVVWRNLVNGNLFLVFLSKYRPLSSEQGKFHIILVNCVKRSHRH